MICKDPEHAHQRVSTHSDRNLSLVDAMTWVDEDGDDGRHRCGLSGLFSYLHQRTLHLKASATGSHLVSQAVDQRTAPSDLREQ
jgi:hypothetical protein